jgi:phosphoribosylamine--glycine ligase
MAQKMEKGVSGVEVQEKVDGIEVGVGGLFNGKVLVGPCEIDFEHKKLMSGEIGPNTGEMGTVMRYTDDSNLAEILLRPLEGHLFRAGYAGFIDVSVMVAKDGTPYPLEFTTRPGWPLFDIQQSLHPEPCEWMKNLLDGKDTFKPSLDVAVGVQIALSPFPRKAKGEEACGVPLYGWDKIPPRNFHIGQAMMGEAPNENLQLEPIPVSSGCEIAVVSGNGPTIEAAAEKAYKHVKKLELPSSPLYRDDIGEKVGPALKVLQAQGYARCFD